MVTIWHNPRCSKSRASLALLEEQNVETEIFKYLNETVTVEVLTSLLKKLGMNARELMRTKEDIYKELGLKDVDDEAELIEAMLQHPSLIERPIVINGNAAGIGRPIEKVIELIK